MSPDEMRERPLDAMNHLSDQRAEYLAKMLGVYTSAIDLERAAVERIDAAVRELREAINAGALEHHLLSNVNIVHHPVVGENPAGVLITWTIVKVLR